MLGVSIGKHGLKHMIHGVCEDVVLRANGVSLKESEVYEVRYLS